jgi:acyl-CoA synthetase (AMP-forming)/AMP-acid ligase II
MPRAQGPIEQLIHHRVAQHPRQTWLKYNDTEFSWEQVLSNIQRAANGLLALGIKPGERIVFAPKRFQPVPPGQVGELAFRHPMGQLTHYHKVPDATASAYRGGWFHSGYLAKVARV